MPSFTVTSPDGKQYKGTAPEGASQDDIFAYVQRQIMAAEPMSVADRALGTKTIPADMADAPVDPSLAPGDAYKRAMFESHPATRLVRGVEGPAIKAIELAGMVPGAERVPGLNTMVRDVHGIQDARRAGMALRYGDPDSRDIAGTVGAVVPALAVGSGIANIAPKAYEMTGLLGVGARAGLGGATGAVTAGMQPGSTWNQAMTGAGLGAAFPLAIDTAQGIRAVGQYLADRVLPSRIFDRFITKAIGQPQLDDAARAIEQYVPTIPGERATAAQILAGKPAGTAIQANQQTVSHTPGGISSRFYERELKNEGARDIAKTYAKQVIVPKGLAAIEAADAEGITSSSLLQNIIQEMQKPGLSTVAKKSLQSVADDILGHTDESGVIKGQELWRIRKELGDVIGTHAKALGSWSKDAAIGTERTLQHFIDDAIDPANARGWKAFLSEYSGKLGAVARSAEQDATKYKPLVSTTIPGGTDVAEAGVRHMFPPWLSRPVTGTKWAVDRVAHAMEPRLDARAADAFLDPKLLADILRTRQVTAVPSRYQPMVDELMRSSAGLAGMYVGRQ